MTVANDLVLVWSVLGAAAAAVILSLFGGMLTPVAGRWNDGDRDIQLRQWGPYLSGRCERAGGYEEYISWALFGWVRLSRHSYGQDFLASIGFPTEVTPQIAGMVTARLRLRLREDSLKGSFIGTRFRFSGNPQQVASTTLEKPVDRTWTRR